jgi:hypothetical protein
MHPWRRAKCCKLGTVVRTENVMQWRQPHPVTSLFVCAHLPIVYIHTVRVKSMALNSFQDEVFSGEHVKMR